MKRTLTIQHRTTGEIATVIDITDMTEAALSRPQDSLIWNIDFEFWTAIDSATPEDET